MTWTWADVVQLSVMITLPLMVMLGLWALAVAHSWRKVWRETEEKLKRDLRESSDRLSAEARRIGSR